MIDDYNLYMIGIDKLDHLMSYYSLLHKSVKWWRKVFFRVLEVTVVNAYIIYKMLVVRRKEKLMSHRAFRRQLIESLSEPIRSRSFHVLGVIPGRLKTLSDSIQSGTFPKWGRRGGTVWSVATASRELHDPLCVVHVPRSLPSALPCRMFIIHTSDAATGFVVTC